MKRITIAIDEGIYRSLIDFAAERSKVEIRRFSVGEAIREILRKHLNFEMSQSNSRKPKSSEQPVQLVDPMVQNAVS